MIVKQCQHCNAYFSRPARIANRPNTTKFCSRDCANLSQRTKLTLSCANCGREFTRTPKQANGSGRNKSNRNFCSRSCAVTYNNTHKTTGNRRSKLESYLESQLRSEFPQLELICNGKEAINSELDFYFPQLRLAIELNGIFHYEPIYGADKLEKIQANDQQKSLRCAAAGIEFCTIDTSTVTHTTSNVKDRYWSIVKNLVVSIMKRASDTNVQVS